MNGLSIIELLLASFSMLCVLRLFVVVFLGDGQAGPVISRSFRRPDHTGAQERRS